MAALKQIAFYSRNIIKWGIIVFVGFFVVKFLFNVSVDLWNRFNPAPPAPPTVSFGKLPVIKFTQKETLGGLEYKLETPTGDFPEFPDRLKVYFMPYLRPNLLALDRAKQQAASLGFRDEPEKVSDNIYKWTKTDFDITTFEMDIFSGSFVYNYSWQDDPSVLTSNNIAGEEEIKQQALGFLSRAQASESDLGSGRIEVDYFKLVGDKLIPAVSLSEASFAKVDIYRKSVDELPVFTADPVTGIVSILIAGGSYGEKILKAEYNYFPIKHDSWGTYPIKTALSAWNELKSGKGYIAHWDSTGDTVIIRRVYLAYFDSDKPQEFFQPIVVFEGDDSFFGYVPAIITDWYQ